MLQQMRSASKLIFILMAVSFVVGFLLLETSGILNSSALTTSTAVAEVNGKDILYTTWQQQVSQAAEQERERRGRSLNGDELRQLEQRVLDEMIDNVLLEQEYERRGISVSDREIQQAADYAPPPALQQQPELQTNGRFDIEKYRRYRRAVGRQGLNLYLESYYRDAIRREKLFDQIATGAYITDQRLWDAWRDQHDSARVTSVSFTPDRIADDKASVSDDELRGYLKDHEKELTRPGRAVISLVSIPRTITAADTAAAREKAVQLRSEIVSGAQKFEDIARAESADTASGSRGGDLGKGPKGRFVAEFENAAWALRQGEISQPVKTQFGFHLIRVDSRSGDSLALHHILIPIQQRDSAARVTDRMADSLAKMAAGKSQPVAFDSAVKRLGLVVTRDTVTEGQPALLHGTYVPDVSAWAFKGAHAGETSDLVDADDAYYLARLDSIDHGGTPSLDAMRPEVTQLVRQRKKLDLLVAQADTFAKAAARSSLEDAAKPLNLIAYQSPMFNRNSNVPGLGRFNAAIGAAFSLPIGEVSAPIRTDDAVVVLRVDARKLADRAAFDAQKTAQRNQILDLLRRQRIQDFVANLRAEAKIVDNRKKIDQATRRSES
ncbi:MAG TPA: peptidylprolyl isomerase [Gemmatimonadaceae bacterium]|nr:peptidylprolyl isomerase [Gemmatimonadaceae bacterium]